MNEDQLRYFLSVYRERNIINAAASAPMTTQGLGKSIRKLESELGAKLFSIDANGGRTPTVFADALALFIDRVDDDRRRLQREFANIHESNSNRLTLSVAVAAENSDVEECANAFSNNHKAITVELTEVSAERCTAMLLDGEVGLGIVEAPFHPRLAMTPLARFDYRVGISWRPDLLGVVGQAFIDFAIGYFRQ